MKRIEHHQTILQSTFRIVDETRSYSAPQPVQQIIYLLTADDFEAARQQIMAYQAQLQAQLDKENADRDPDS